MQFHASGTETFTTLRDILRPLFALLVEQVGILKADSRF